MFGIKIATIDLPRRCESCHHEHRCVAHLVASTVPKHAREKRPVRSRFAWFASAPTQYGGEG